MGAEKPPPTFGRFRRSTQQSIEQIAASLPPDGEWNSMLLIESPLYDFNMLPLAGHDSNSRADLAWVTNVIVQAQATRVARIQGAVERGAQRELITLQVATVDRHDVRIAEVTRRPDGPPTLGRWERRTAAGPIADSLKVALVAAQRLN